MTDGDGRHTPLRSLIRSPSHPAATTAEASAGLPRPAAATGGSAAAPAALRRRQPRPPLPLRRRRSGPVDLEEAPVAPGRLVAARLRAEQREKERDRATQAQKNIHSQEAATAAARTPPANDQLTKKRTRDSEWHPTAATHRLVCWQGRAAPVVLLVVWKRHLLQLGPWRTPRSDNPQKQRADAEAEGGGDRW